jgi:AcrR family transcriptional regulator
MAGAWLREEQAELAAEKILDAASKAFVERGVFRTGMGEIASFAGCSRGTLYRYFKNREALHRAYIDHWAARLAGKLRAELEDIDDPGERLVEGILAAVRLVRDTPGMAVWFTPGDSGLTAQVSSDSERIYDIASRFVESLLAQDAEAEGRLRAGWLVRVVVSLLTLPGANAAEERALVTRFVAPGPLRESPA